MKKLFVKPLFGILFNLIVLDNIHSTTAEVGKTCAVLYSERNHEGDQYNFKDDARVSNFEEGHISAPDGWNQTLSFAVGTGCHLLVCNETYFSGSCQIFSESLQDVPQGFEAIFSGTCNCDKECKCSDIKMRRTSCAKAYFKPGCNICNPSYTDFKGSKPYLPKEYDGKIGAIKVRDGCRLTLFEGEDYDGKNVTVTSDIVDRPLNTTGSYECECFSEPSQLRPKPDRPSQYPTLIDMPKTIEEINNLLKGEHAGHPGLLAAKQSLRNGRSSKHVYILAIGSTGAGKSSAINLLFDNANLTNVGDKESTTKEIYEFRVPLPIDELGVANSELRVIDTPGMGDTNGLADDAKFLATLDDYLSTHEELNNRIPNIVLIFHKFTDNRFSGPQSNFVKMLRGFDSLRNRLTDPNFSNVIFVLSHFCSEVRNIITRPQKRLNDFKEAIDSYSQFPKPILIAVAENKAAEQDLPMVNGYYKLPNGEFYPRNVFDKILFATANGGDPIGEAVITTGFRDSDEFNITRYTHTLNFEANDQKLTKYLDIMTAAVIEITNTTISQLLAASYETMNSALKKNYPGALFYLQKAFNSRNIGSPSDIPKTSAEILNLVTSLKQNEAILYLLEHALEIIPPNFPQNVVTGYSYDVFKDNPLPKTPFEMRKLINSDIGYLLPSEMTCNVVNMIHEIFQVKENRAEYLKQRMLNWGIQGHMAEDNFKGSLKPGFNIRTESSQSDRCYLTAVREYRNFVLTLNHKPWLTQEFTDVLLNLPVFNESDSENLKVWKELFDNYGTHVVKSVHGGGSIEIELSSNKECNTNLTQALFGLIQFTEELTSLSDDSKLALKTGEIHLQVRFKGGNVANHTSDLSKMKLDDSFALLQNWKKSLKQYPTILTTEMQLLPISEVAKNVGHNQNISLEIKRATTLLFNSSLVYTPPLKIGEIAPPPRVETYLPENFHTIYKSMIDALLLQSKASEERMEKLINQMREDQNRIAAENAIIRQRELDRQIKEDERLMAKEQKEEDRRLAKEKEEDDRRLAKEKEENDRRREEEVKRRREEQSRIEAAQKAAEAKAKEVNGCLQKGTLILLPNGEEKPVELLQIGDVILDHRLNPTRVLGVSSEFIMSQTFYGFDNNSFFFTETHIFAGPLEGTSVEGLQFYAQDTNWLLRVNPLMEYLNVRPMSLEGFNNIYSFDKSNIKVSSKSVQVFKDPVVHAADTLVYYLKVDSPSGTYFANGFVCRHEVPPVEYWPNTMAIFFDLRSNPDFMYFENVPYTMKSAEAIYKAAEDIRLKVEEALNSLIVQDLVVDDDKIELNAENAEIVINSMYRHPSFSIFAMSLYNQVGPVVSKYLDICNNANRCIPGEYLGSVQKLLREVISKQIAKFIEFNFVPVTQVYNHKDKKL